MMQFNPHTRTFSGPHGRRAGTRRPGDHKFAPQMLENLISPSYTSPPSSKRDGVEGDFSIPNLSTDRPKSIGRFRQLLRAKSRDRWGRLLLTSQVRAGPGCWRKKTSPRNAVCSMRELLVSRRLKGEFLCQCRQGAH